MNKKIVLFGAAALIAFSALTAFRGGKTVAEQMKEVEAAVTTKVAEFQAQKDQECMDRVNTEAKTRFDAEMAAATAPGEPTKGITATKGGKKPAKPTSKGGPKVDPLPQPAPPSKTDPAKTRGGAVDQSKPEEVKKRGGAVETTSPAKKEEVKKRGGAVPSSGGGN